MTAFIERLIRILDTELLPSEEDQYLSGALGILVADVGNSYSVAIITTESVLISVERLRSLKHKLELDQFTDMDVSIFVDEVTVLRNRNLKLIRFHIFTTEKEEE